MTPPGYLAMARFAPEAFNHAGWVKVDEAFYACSVIDMTRTGARLILEHPLDLPDAFSLQLTRDGKVLPSCILIWQDGEAASVSFG
jgi:hypothetical protein